MTAAALTEAIRARGSACEALAGVTRQKNDGSQCDVNAIDEIRPAQARTAPLCSLKLYDTISLARKTNWNTTNTEIRKDQVRLPRP
jgi:hypothetical protein